MDRLSLRFAELLGNSRLDEGAITGGSEIIMLSKYLNGARVNVCSGDSGGPILVVGSGASRLHQLAVTSAADEDCREAAIFAPIGAQRDALRSMFDTLMQGEVGANQNPF
jgi:secreted trypsin-like serine protease